jgi:RecB family exonuclease
VGVLLAPLDAAPPLTLDRVFVLGMAEGALPSRPQEQPLLPDPVRGLLRARLPGSPAARALPTRAERVEEQRHALFAVLGGAAHVTVSHPRGDRRQRRERAPSGWFLELAGRRARLERPLLADELRVIAREATAPWYRSIPSVRAGIEQGPEPATRSEWVARELLATLRRGEEVHTAPVVAGDPALLAAVSAVRERAAAAFTAWDGNVGPSPALDAHLARRHAPTVLARYGTCPRQYFLSTVLGVRERESREDPFALEGSRRGILLHGILEGVLRSFAATPPATLDEARAVLRRTTDRALSGDHEAATTSLRARLSQEAVRAWLERWLHEHTALAAELGVRPVAAEVAFGADADPLGAVRVTLPSGREVSFRGRVDRLDATPDGGVVLVVDYKTTSDERYRGIEADPVLGGQELQLAVYGLAAAQRHPAAEITARYWFLGPRTSRAGQRGFVFDAERRERTVAVLDVLTEGIAAGSFPPRPGEWNEFRQAHEHCRSCVFDRICPSSGEREREWRRAAAAPEVLPYAALVGASR